MAELTINPDHIRDALKDFAKSYDPGTAATTEVGHVVDAADPEHRERMAQVGQVPQERIRVTSTGSPTVRSTVPAPTASTTPTPSNPG